MRWRIRPSVWELSVAWCGQVAWSVRRLRLALIALRVCIHWAAAPAYARKRWRNNLATRVLLAAWSAQVAWSVRLLWLALLARHVDSLGCCVSLCM